MPSFYQSVTKKLPAKISEQETRRSLHKNDVSICVTEENKHINEVNPVALADKEWTDGYKLAKLMVQQKKNKYLTNQIFGSECQCKTYVLGDSCPLKARLDAMFGSMEKFAVSNIKYHGVSGMSAMKSTVHEEKNSVNEMFGEQERFEISSSNRSCKQRDFPADDSLENSLSWSKEIELLPAGKVELDNSYLMEDQQMQANACFRK